MTDPNSLQTILQSKWNQGLTWRAFLEYSTKNLDQLRANYDATDIPAETLARLKAAPGEIRILLIGADWCGDVVANGPSIARLADALPKVELRVFDRDRHADLTDHFLTNGARAIPKAVICNVDFSRHTTWGPRPALCQAIMTENKDKMPKEEIYPMIRAWYANDKNQTLLREISAKIEEIAAN